jgi:thymidylate synthase (FAD)
MRYLREVDGEEWAGTASTVNPGQKIVEFAGRMCYRSWKPGLNRNVTKVRTDPKVYIDNILKSGHGSVLEHANYTFVFHNISRIITHELVRHRAGTAISQESMRYVRLDEIPMWIPEWAQEDDTVMWLVRRHLQQSEQLVADLANYFELDAPKVPFAEKKAKTSFTRRFAPSGHATSMTWTANVRALRHVIETRTATGAEEEIRIVFGKVAEIMVAEAPLLFGDFERQDDGSWIPEWSKV